MICSQNVRSQFRVSRTLIFVSKKTQSEHEILDHNKKADRIYISDCQGHFSTSELSDIGENPKDISVSMGLFRKEYCAYGKLAPREINLDLFDTSLIITRKLSKKKKNNVFAIQSYFTTLGSAPILEYLYTSLFERGYWSW